MKRVYQFNNSGKLINCYKSVAEAARNVGVTKETISAICNGKRKSSRGYYWSYDENASFNITEFEDCIWKDIPGYEGKYQMSENREVRRLPYSVTQRDNNGNIYVRHFGYKKIDQAIDQEGYLSVSLDGVRVRIHWLYYNTFIEDTKGYLVDHIDRNKLNNDSSNLRLVTPKQNTYNRILPYRPDIQNQNIKYQRKHNGSLKKPYYLRFTEDGKRRAIGHYATYEEAENKYRELYNERQKRIDANSKVLTINS